MVSRALARGGKAALEKTETKIKVKQILFSCMCCIYKKVIDNVCREICELGRKKL